jgi:hypothetical protein
MEQFLIEEKLRDYKLRVYDPFLMDCRRINPNEWADLKDFLTTDGIDLVNNLNKISVPRLRKLVSSWIYNRNKKQSVDEVCNIDINPILELDNKFKWVELVSEQSFKNEGILMNNCIAGYFNKSKNKERCIIYSLRNDKNEPKVSVEYYPLLHRVMQVRGRSNNLINLKYSKYLAELFNFLNSKCLNHFDYKRDWVSQQSLQVSDVLENLGIYIKDSRFEQINKDSDILYISSNFYYKKRLGKIKSIKCKRLRLDFKDVDSLHDTIIKTEELVIRGINNGENVELSKNWTVEYFDNVRSNSSFLFNDDHLNFVFIDYFDFDLVRNHRTQELSLQRLADLTSLCRPAIFFNDLNQISIDNIRNKILGSLPKIEIETRIDQVLGYTAKGFENDSIRVTYNIGFKKDFLIVFDSIASLTSDPTNQGTKQKNIILDIPVAKIANKLVDKPKFNGIGKTKNNNFPFKHNKLNVL